jgi:heat shock protein HslJ
MFSFRTFRTRPVFLATAAVLAALSFAGCDDATEPTDIVGGTWRLERIRPTGNAEVVSVSDPSRFTIEFETDGQVSVRADCNSCGGRYTIADDETLTVTDLTCTLIACPGAPLDTQFVGILQGARSIEIEDDRLEIRSADGGELFFER